MKAVDNSVYSVMDHVIRGLEMQGEKRYSDTAVLAELRHSVGIPLSEAAGVWPFLFENVPESFLSSTGKITYEEMAVFSALQIYAVCRQGTAGNVIADETYRGSMGKSMRVGRTPDREKALDRRFNAMITASDVNEFTYHLRQMIKVIKSKTQMTVNFARLAEDIYWYQRGRKDQICFRWATDYYFREYADKEEGVKEKETVNE